MKCVICGNVCTKCLDLNKQPLANNLLINNSDEYDTFNLGLEYCTNCGHGQLTKFVSPKLLFSHYLYASGTSRTLDRYFSSFAESIIRKHSLKAKVLDVASNDGSFLKKLIDQGVLTLGVDPAKNLAQIANADNVSTICDFFPSVKINEKFDVITAMNVCAHTPDPLFFLSGIRDCLADNGRAYIQTSQALMLNSGQFDTIYHEHFSFFTVSSMAEACRKVGLHLVNYELVDIHGISVIFHLALEADGSAELFKYESLKSSMPLTTNIMVQETYSLFKSKAEKTINTTKDYIKNHREQGYRIVMAGVAAKAMTFYHASDISCDYFIDEAELKIGRYIPGENSAISDFHSLPEGYKYLIIVGAWNFFDEIKQKLTSNFPKSKLKFLKYFPEVVVE
jgi:2-polyprenyl-3-methyl-5-hydroxy-6-metoxy-1,4-benzoquinol methylase